MLMSTDLERETPPELESLMAQQLAVALTARHVGFSMEPFDFEWWVGCSRQRPLPLASGIHLLTSDSSEQRRSYIEKRIAVLCARAYATTLILERKACAEGGAQNPAQFWQSLSDNGDYSRAAELCVAYLIEDEEKPKSSDPDGDFIKRVSQYIGLHGLRSVAEVLTKTEFLLFVSGWLSNFKRSSGFFRTTISTELLESYKPGLATLKIIDADLPAERAGDKPTDLPLANRIRNRNDDNQSRRCLVAHEVGHWLAARYVEIPTAGVEIKWRECSGSCTVYLGLPAFEWSLERYLRARIVVLCAGTFADCWMRYPEKRTGIGNEFYANLFRGSGVDDFAKLTELYLLYRTIRPSPTAQSGLASPPSPSEILESLLTLLKESGLHQSLVSSEFEALVTHLSCEAQVASSALTNRPSESVTFSTEVLDDACAEYGLSPNGRWTAAL